jgi:FHA domain
MNDAKIRELLTIYTGMRSQGVDAKRSIASLRTQIELLPAADQAELVRQVREWETYAEQQGSPDDSRPKIKPISSKLPRIDPNALKNASKTMPVRPGGMSAADLVACPHCGKYNQAQEAICFSCGQPIKEDAIVNTRKLADNTSNRDSFFGNDSILVLSVRGSNVTFKVRPQKQKHDVVIGRADNSMKPDIDLTEFSAGTMGVSRMHVTIHFDAQHNTLSVMDMNTMNGTFVNGVRLYPQEVRVLQHGDELRLGQLTMNVHFYFAEG